MKIDKMKYSEWRPIGVIDTAQPGEMKAQMFTREDFLKITARGINRENWEKSPEVLKIIHSYGAKLAKMSTLTQEMKNPTVSGIALVGTVMKLRETPTLNRESKDGKLQFFQLKFVDGKRFRMKWMWFLLAILALLVAALLVFAILKKNGRSGFKKRSVSFSSHSFCEGERGSSGYVSNLDEVQGILNRKINYLVYERKLDFSPDCSARMMPLKDREALLLQCYQVMRKTAESSSFRSSSMEKVEQCVRKVCEQKMFSGEKSCRF